MKSIKSQPELLINFDFSVLSREEKQSYAFFINNLLFDQADSIKKTSFILRFFEQQLNYEFTKINKNNFISLFLKKNDSFLYFFLKELSKQPEIKNFIKKIFNYVKSKSNGRFNIAHSMNLNEIKLYCEKLKLINGLNETICSNNSVASSYENSEVEEKLNEEYLININKKALLRKYQESNSDLLKQYVGIQIANYVEGKSCFGQSQFLEQIYSSKSGKLLLSEYTKSFNVIVEIIEHILYSLNNFDAPLIITQIMKNIKETLETKIPEANSMDKLIILGKFFFGILLDTYFENDFKLSVLSEGSITKETSNSFSVAFSIFSQAASGNFYLSEKNPSLTVFNFYFIDLIPKLNAAFEELCKENEKVKELLEFIKNQENIFSSNLDKKNDLMFSSFCFSLTDFFISEKIIESNAHLSQSKQKLKEFQINNIEFDKYEEESEEKFWEMLKSKEKEKNEKIYSTILFTKEKILDISDSNSVVSTSNDSFCADSSQNDRFKKLLKKIFREVGEISPEKFFISDLSDPTKYFSSLLKTLDKSFIELQDKISLEKEINEFLDILDFLMKTGKNIDDIIKIFDEVIKESKKKTESISYEDLVSLKKNINYYKKQLFIKFKEKELVLEAAKCTIVNKMIEEFTVCQPTRRNPTKNQEITVQDLVSNFPQIRGISNFKNEKDYFHYLKETNYLTSLVDYFEKIKESLKNYPLLENFKEEFRADVYSQFCGRVVSQLSNKLLFGGVETESKKYYHLCKNLSATINVNDFLGESFSQYEEEIKEVIYFIKEMDYSNDPEIIMQFFNKAMQICKGITTVSEDIPYQKIYLYCVIKACNKHLFSKINLATFFAVQWKEYDKRKKFYQINKELLKSLKELGKEKQNVFGE